MCDGCTEEGVILNVKVAMPHFRKHLHWGSISALNNLSMVPSQQLLERGRTGRLNVTFAKKRSVWNSTCGGICAQGMKLTSKNINAKHAIKYTCKQHLFKITNARENRNNWQTKNWFLANIAEGLCHEVRCAGIWLDFTVHLERFFVVSKSCLNTFWVGVWISMLSLSLIFIGTCYRIFPTTSDLDEHQLKHTKKAITPTPCDICGKVLKSPFIYKRHKISMHSTPDEIFCRTCLKRCETTDELNAHKLECTLKRQLYKSKKKAGSGYNQY